MLDNASALVGGLVFPATIIRPRHRVSEARPGVLGYVHSLARRGALNKSKPRHRGIPGLLDLTQHALAKRNTPWLTSTANVTDARY